MFRDDAAAAALSARRSPLHAIQPSCSDFILQRTSLIICTGATAWAQPPSAEAIVLFSSSLVVDS